MITENILSQVDSEGLYYKVFTKVNDNMRDDRAITKVNDFIKSIIGNLHWRRTTCGWKILLELKDGSVDWVPLNNLKHSNQVELAEYDIGNKMSDEPAFIWLVKETLHHQYRIIPR